MNNPKIKIEPSIIDNIIESVGILGLLLLICLPIYFYNVLPDSIPTHFNGNGEVDDYSNKSTLWLLPIIGVVNYIGLFWLNKFPHIFNYLVKITEENAQIQYRIATKMIRSINVIVTWLFTYITYTMIQVGIGNQIGMNSKFVFFFIAIMTTLIGYFLFKSIKAK